jgi:hypothetical protein
VAGRPHSAQRFQAARAPVGRTVAPLAARVQIGLKGVYERFEDEKA